MRALLEMKTRERIPGNPANRPHNDPLRETSGKLYSAERGDPRALFVRVEESKERGILAAKGKGIPRYRGASCLVRNCRIFKRRRRYAIRRARRTYGIYLPRDGKPIRYLPGTLSTARAKNRARVTRHSLPNKWTMFQERS